MRQDNQNGRQNVHTWVRFHAFQGLNHLKIIILVMILLGVDVDGYLASCVAEGVMSRALVIFLACPLTVRLAGRSERTPLTGDSLTAVSENTKERRDGELKGVEVKGGEGR